MYIDEGKPVPGLIETTVREPARGRAELVLHGAERLRGAAALLARGRAAAKHFLPATQSALVRGRGAVAIGVRPDAGACACRLRRAHHVPDRPGLDRKRADGDRADVAEQGLHQYGRAGAGRGAQARSMRRQARGASARPQHHAGLLAPARSHRRRLRCRWVLQARRRAQVRGPRRSRRGPVVRRPHRRGLQARHRHLGECRARCARACWRSSNPMRATSSSPAPIATRSAR